MLFLGSDGRILPCIPMSERDCTSELFPTVGQMTLAEALTDCEVEVLPGISSLQYFCAKLQRPWEQVRVVSLHGREEERGA